METVKSPAEGKVLLRNVSWETYERLLEDHLERRKPHFYYDRGVLEILSPSAEHEGIGYIIGVLVDLLAEEMELDVLGAAHTTFRRGDVEGGFEADASFYFSENAALVRGKKRIDLDVDPPPDLVVEVDITHPSLDKLPIYARLGIPEVWRHDGERLTVLGLKVVDAGRSYTEVPKSTFLTATGNTLTRFIKEGLKTRRPDWVRRVREWARETDRGSEGV